MDPAEAPAELAAIRLSIDNIDAALVHMLAERFKFTQKVGRLKAASGMPPSDPERERVQIARLRAIADGGPARSGLRREVVQLRRGRGHPPPRAARHRRGADARRPTPTPPRDLGSPAPALRGGSHLRGHRRQRRASATSRPSSWPSAGARVILASRSAEKAAARDRVDRRARAGRRISSSCALDLTSLAVGRGCRGPHPRALGPIDGLINNAGLRRQPARRGRPPRTATSSSSAATSSGTSRSPRSSGPL